MDEIRIGLIIFGAVILVAIYIWERRASKKRAAANGKHLTDEADQLSVSSIKKKKKKSNPAGGKQNFLVLYVNAPTGEFLGQEIRISLIAHGLRFSPSKGLFESPIIDSDDDEDNVMFSVANMVNPGVFPDEKLEDFQTVGLAFLMMLPVATDPLKAFEKMLQTANQVAGQLHGRLLDQNHNILTKQGINFMREKVVNSNHQGDFARRHSV